MENTVKDKLGKPLVISVGLFLFLFGLAYAKASKPDMNTQNSLQARHQIKSTVHSRMPSSIATAE